MADDFHTLTTPRRLEGGHEFVLTVPDGWQQGRGAFGGFVLASLVHAIESVAADRSRSLRSLTATLCGPVVVGDARILVEALRIGSGTATYAARVVQHGEVQTHGVAILGKPREVEGRWVDLEEGTRPDWRGVEPVPPMEGLAPTFASHFEFRNVGPVPYTEHPAARALGWIRARSPGVRDDAYLVAGAGVYWPSSLARFATIRPIATVSFSFTRVEPLDGLDADAPFFHEGHTISARDGYTVERRTLRGEDGRLLAVNEQTIVLIR
jgi:hypothetical protein